PVRVFLPSFVSTICRPPLSSLFPYTTLFRSRPHRRLHGAGADLRAHLVQRRDPRGRDLIRDPRHLSGLPDGRPRRSPAAGARVEDRKSTRLNSSHVSISYAVFCLKKKTQRIS